MLRRYSLLMSLVMIFVFSPTGVFGQQNSTKRHNRSLHQADKFHNKRTEQTASKASLFSKLGEANQISSGGGNFILKASSPTYLTCVVKDPTTNFIYAQEDGDTAFYKYYPDSNKWVQLKSCPINSGNNGGAVYLNGKIYTNYTSGGYLAKAGHSGGGLSKAAGTEEGGGGGGFLGVYNIANNSWTVDTSQVATGNIETFNGYIYLVGPYDFQRFNPTTDHWDTLAHPSIADTIDYYGFDGEDTWGALRYYNGYLYNIQGNGSLGFARYNIDSARWTILDPIPDPDGAVLGSAIDPRNNTLYAYGGYGDSNWFAYDLINGAWTKSPEPLFQYLDDGGMAYVSTGPTPGIYFTEGEGGMGFAVFQATRGPHSEISFFQDKYLTQYVDVVAIVDQAPASTPIIRVTNPNNSTQDLTVNTVDGPNHVYYGHYELTASGTFTFNVNATDGSGNNGDTSRTLTAVLSKANVNSGIQSTDGLASLAIAAGSLSRDAYVTITSERSNVTLNESAHGLSDLYSFGPAGIELQKPVNVTFDYSKLSNVDESHLAVYQKTSGGFTPINTTVDRSARTVSTTVSQLGQYQLFYDEGFKTGSANAVPKQFTLSQNYPNPFNPATTIKFELPLKSNVALTIYNILGQEVRSLANREFNAGSYSIVWDGKNNTGNFTSSGIYIYQIKTDKFVKARKMVLIK